MTTVETHDRITYGRTSGAGTSEEMRRVKEGEQKACKGAAATAGIGGLAAVILAILGLINVAPLYMAAIAVIVAGVGMLAERFLSGAFQFQGDIRQSGFSADIIASFAAIVLGLLALLGANPEVLLPVAVLVLGSVDLLLGRGRLANGGNVLFGVASMVLGILGLAGSVPLTLSLVALLCLGCGTILNTSPYFSAFGLFQSQHA